MPTHTFTGIIDVYHKNELKLSAAKANGVTAIIHKASEGVNVTDPKYAARKAEAMAKGFLWGAYHLTNGAPPKKQLENFLAVEDGSNPKVLMALDWERSTDGTVVDLNGIREFIRLFHGKLGRYPMLYGGWTLRDSPSVIMGDELLAKCPLWYQRYRSSPVGLPEKTWQTYTLWQFADENRGFGAPPSNILPGADFNRYRGTAEDLASAWPFTVATPLPGQTPDVPVDTYIVTANSLNIRKEPGLASVITGTLTMNDRVRSLGFSDDAKWLKIDAGAKGKGYCSRRWLRKDVGGDIPGEPAWMTFARGELGIHEVNGPGDHPRIVEYLMSTDIGAPANRNDETFWCSAFVNWCLEEAQIEGTNSAWARNWLTWGKKLTTPAPGCIVVLSRGDGGHVGFFVEKRDGRIFLLGGNQSDEVNITGHDASRLLGYRTLA